MGTKLSRTVREHKEAAASPQFPASQQNQLDKISRQECYDEQTDNAAVAAPISTQDLPEPELTSTHDTDAMEIDSQPRLSNESPSPSIFRDDEPTGRPRPARREKPQPPARAVQTCLICCSPCDGSGQPPTQEVHPCSRCDHAYCVPCLKSMFLDACKDTSRMPPRCCNQIPLHHVRPYLTADEVSLFKAKYEEWGTPNPFYCPVARCSAFIPDRLLPHAKENGKGKQRVDSGIGTPTKPTITCPSCEVDICTNCRSLAHADGICSPFDFGTDEQTADLLQKWGYRKCPKCGQGVKRMYGCNHMECRCGAHFCWGCMQGRDNCVGDCEEEDDDYPESEPDQEEDYIVKEETTAPPVSNLGAHTPSGKVIETITAQEGTEQLPSTTENLEGASAQESSLPARVRNLDGGSSRYWEEQDIDFGEEPGDNYADASWDCAHYFYTAKIKLKEALSTNAAANPMECMKCWATIHPEVVMPGSSSNSNRKSKITVAITPAGRHAQRLRWLPAQETRRRGFASLRGNRSMEGLEAVAWASPLSTSPASFSSFMGADSPFAASLQREGFSAHVVDLYGNAVTTAKRDNPDEEMPDWSDADGAKSKFDFKTGSTPFSFAFECNSCGLLVCHRCKESLEYQRVHEEEDEKQVEDWEGDVEEDGDTQDEGDGREFTPILGDFELETREREYDRLWTEWVAAPPTSR